MDRPDDLEENTSEEKAEQVPLRMETAAKTRNVTFLEKLKYFKNNVTVEPVAGLYIMGSAMLIVSLQNFYLEKACLVNLKYDENVCTDLKLRKTVNHSLEEYEIQKSMASAYAWRNFLFAILPITTILFLGAWSDKTGKRKICLLLPITGDLVTCAFSLLMVYYFYEISLELTILLQIFFLAMTGGWHTITLGTFSYISDVVSEETRTFRLGVLNLCIMIGFPIGMSFSGVLVQKVGYYGVISIAMIVFLCLFCYVCFVIEDHNWLEDKTKRKRKGCTGYLSSFFDIETLKETLGIIFNKGPKNRRLKICLIMVVTSLYYAPYSGEMSILYIFTRYRFNWDEVKYSVFYTYYLVIRSIGTLFSITVFSKILKMDDAILGMISATSKICGALVLAFAKYDYEAYLFPLVEMFNGTTEIAFKSLVSKLASQQELGKLFSLIGITEALTSLVVSPIYSWIYVKTLHILPGAFMLFSTLVTIPAFFIFAWFYYERKKDQKEINILE